MSIGRGWYPDKPEDNITVLATDILRVTLKDIFTQEKTMVKPYDKRMMKDDKRAIKNTEKGVKPVAKDTNKTRRGPFKAKNMKGEK